MSGIVKNVNVFSNPSWIDLMVAVTICFVVVAIAFNAPAGMDNFLFANRSLVANLSVMKWAVEHESNNARHLIGRRLQSKTSTAALVINSRIVVFAVNDICRSSVDASFVLWFLSAVNELFGVFLDGVQRFSTPAGATSQFCIWDDADAFPWWSRVLCFSLHLRQFRNLHSSDLWERRQFRQSDASLTIFILFWIGRLRNLEHLYRGWASSAQIEHFDSVVVAKVLTDLIDFPPFPLDAELFDFS